MKIAKSMRKACNYPYPNY